MRCQYSALTVAAQELLQALTIGHVSDTAGNPVLDSPSAPQCVSATPGRSWHRRQPQLRVDTIPAEQFAVVGANIRTLRLRNGWTQAELGELMGWPTVATVCGAEGHREGRQRGFTAEEVRQLAGIFGVSAQRLTTRCVNCDGNPPAGFVCLRCGARSQT